MSLLPCDTLLKDISIPGSHDSGTYTCSIQACFSSQCQSLNITQQLKAGIRYFDLRVELFEKVLYIYHGPAKMEKFQVVVDQLASFLINSQETLLLAFQSHKQSLPASDLGKMVTDQLNKSILPLGTYSKGISLGELRGKAILIAGYNIDFEPSGIMFPGQN
jgi:1-phosphatidylinositol phosphodiesterase